MQEDFSIYNGPGTELRKAQLRMLEMLKEFDRICKKHNIEYVISGGTCLGAVRHGGFIPWDDDLDIDISYSHYKKLNKVLAKELSEQYFLQTPKTDKGYYQVFSRIVDKNSRIYYPEDTMFLRDNLNYQGVFLDIFPLGNIFSYRFKKIIDSRYMAFFRSKRGIKRKKHNNFFKKVIIISIWPLLKLTISLLNQLVSLRIPLLRNRNKYSHIFGTNITPRLNEKHIFPAKTIVFENHEFLGPAEPEKYLTDLYGDYMKIPTKEKRLIHSVKVEVF
jgi:lipopolysaccharide cholinephosphotransferase